MDQITEIALDDLHESPSNPRKHFNDAYLQDLAADIKAHGRVLSPLLVRPRVPPLFRGADDADATVGHEIVFGHCRYRAAQLAGLASVPCMVRSMDDIEVKRAQISENLQRKDVHPIEEAEGFQALIDEHNETADRIAESLGGPSKRSYVYARLKLLQACPEVRKACLAGDIGSEVALLIARLRTPKLQEHALAKINAHNLDIKDGGKKSYRYIRDLLSEHYTLDLDKAPFPIEEEMLVSKAGNCVRCYKRSGNAPEFADLLTAERHHYSSRPIGANVCTDPDCYAEKKVVFFKREADALRAKGNTVIDGNKARSAMDAYGRPKGIYTPLAEVRTAIKGAATKIETVTIQSPVDGKTIEVVKTADLVAVGLKEAAKPTAGASSPATPLEDLTAKAEAISAQRYQLLLDVRTAMATTERSMFDLELIARFLVDDASYEHGELLERLWGVDDIDDLRDRIGTLSAKDLAQLIMDCTLLDHVHIDRWSLHLTPDNLLAAGTHYGVEPRPTSDAPAQASLLPEGATT